MTGLCRGVSVLGSTGSIGCSTLDVVRLHPERYRVTALTANRDWEGLARQCIEFGPQVAVIAEAAFAPLLRERLREAGCATEVLTGIEGLEVAATLPEADSVMAAIVGAAGLLPALAAVRAGKRLLLANKEALVVSGALFIEEARRHDATILPIDSEHNAVFQCLPAHFAGNPRAVGVRRILLTASGGPFRTWPLARLEQATPEQACRHPNWSMGRKISVDSATMMNKGLEVIEACWLFNLRPADVQVVLHPQSVIHSLVEYVDGSMLAQLGNPDMRTPIAHALAWPERIESGVASLDLFQVAHLDFEPPDTGRFPCLALAFQAVEAGGATPAVLNAANEVAVAAFLDGQVGFGAIPAIITETLGRLPAVSAAGDLETLLEFDRRAREVASLAAKRRGL